MSVPKKRLRWLQRRRPSARPKRKSLLPARLARRSVPRLWNKPGTSASARRKQRRVAQLKKLLRAIRPPPPPPRLESTEREAPPGGGAPRPHRRLPHRLVRQQILRHHPDPRAPARLLANTDLAHSAAVEEEAGVHDRRPKMEAERMTRGLHLLLPLVQSYRPSQPKSTMMASRQWHPSARACGALTGAEVVACKTRHFVFVFRCTSTCVYLYSCTLMLPHTIAMLSNSSLS